MGAAEAGRAREVKFSTSDLKNLQLQCDGYEEGSATLSG